MNDCLVCRHWGPEHACGLGRAMSDCGDGCSAYDPDSRRQPCEVWTRVMGYHRPVESWNAGKQGEYAERKHFKEPSNDPST